MSGEKKTATNIDLFEKPLSVIVFGATGDLAKKKLFPALYQLILLGHFPRNINILGYGRTDVVLEKFIAQQCSAVKEKPGLPMADFVSRISFYAGAYESEDAFAGLDKKLKGYEGGKPGNRLFFLSIPPFIFGTVCQMISAKARAAEEGFTHLIIEKPFGKDSASFEELNAKTASLFREDQLYRIDHYLGKEVVLNLMTLRFANQLFEPLWNNQHIDSVEITFKEDLGTGGRGGYFDSFGIIRDIMQNHLLQVFMFLAIEPPKSLHASDIENAKVELLKCVETLSLKKGVFLGQFTKNSWLVNGKEHTEPGYLDDETVPAGSKCPTFAATVLNINNDRWRGVPFLIKAGKGLDERLAEVRVRFKPTPYNKVMMEKPQGNELVMRIQPDEALYLKMFSKEPGMNQVVKPTVMDMKYATQFPGAYVGDAYERMFLNAAKGEGSLFVSANELVEAWRIFTPLLHEIDEKKPNVHMYPFGSRAPCGFSEWSETQARVPQTSNWQEYLAAADMDSLELLFKKLDTNQSGSLNATSVYALVKEFYDGREPPPEKIAQIVSLLDGDGDGAITLDELKKGAGSLYHSFGVCPSKLDHT